MTEGVNAWLKLIRDAIVGGGAGAATAATDKSGIIAAGGTAQTLAAANTARIELSVQNISSGDLWVSEVETAAADTDGSNRLIPGALATIRSSGAISIIGATTGQKFTAVER